MNLRKYIYSHCVHPLKIKIWDSYLQEFVVREIPCGKCVHCANTHVNEWCTRLFAQRKYSKYCYYVSLDYAPFDEASPVAMQLAKETAAVKHDLNIRHKYGLHPLVLCKNHLQDFFKRLRKNTKVKLQYFACGEYGTHANGIGYGRPHFHTIVFCDTPISERDFVKAWTIDGYKIGRVDYKDMNVISTNSSEQLKIFRYVCKYLQKTDFDFEKLATIDFHRAYFESLEKTLFHSETLFPVEVPITDRLVLARDWREYVRAFSPFIVCSRRPSIGAAYLTDNLDRFKVQDFRLFGLPMEGLAFPRYFQRKAQESLYSIKCIGRESEKPSSAARMGHILQILHVLQDARLDIDTWDKTRCQSWHLYKEESNDGRHRLYISISQLPGKIAVTDLSFYDAKNKFLYQFNGYDYNVWCKLNNGVFSLLDCMDVCDVLREFHPSWDRYHAQWLTPLYEKRILREQELNDIVHALYKPTDDKDSFELFYDHVYSVYQTELAVRYKTKLLSQNSHNTL